MIRAWLRTPWETMAVTAFAAAAVLFAGFEIAAGLRKLEGPRWWPSLWPRAGAPMTILYDATCVLCSKSKGRLEQWRTSASMRFLALQTDEARALLPGMDPKIYMGAMHVVEDGKVYSAHEGWFRIMRLAPLPLALVAALIPAWLAGPVYAWIARNRYHWFGRVCDGGSCQVHPGPKA